MVNNSTSDSLRKRLKVKKPYTDNCSFESIGRTAGVNFTLQLVYVWQLINIMSHSIAVSGHNLNNQYNLFSCYDEFLTRSEQAIILEL